MQNGPEIFYGEILYAINGLHSEKPL